VGLEGLDARSRRTNFSGARGAAQDESLVALGPRLNLQDRRFVGIVVSNANHVQGSSAQGDRVTGSPVGYGRFERWWNRQVSRLRFRA
jgi:hypothetical protein